MKHGKVIFKILLTALFCTACGIEDYPYIEPVPQSYVQTTSNYSVTVQLPVRPSPFTHYSIYYKIYISDRVEYSPEKSNLESINKNLSNDYLALEQYTDTTLTTTTTTASSSTIASVFSNRKYFFLDIEDGDVNSVLSPSTSSDKVTIFFSQNPGEIPYLFKEPPPSGITEPIEYNLLRFDPESNLTYELEYEGDNRYFITDRELYNTENLAAANVNPDIADASGTGGSSDFLEYNLYVSMYIIACGLDFQNYTPIYSTPTFLHIMRLPNAQ